MIALTFTLRPRTALATPLMGDTLFGQLCWTIRNGWDDARLVGLLDGYTNGHPFLVVSDAFPAGHLPLPVLPARCWQRDDAANPEDRKALKKKIWLPVEALAAPLESWQQRAATSKETGLDSLSQPQPRNSLNRLTGTTGDGFAPYSVRQHWYDRGAVLDLHVRLDESRLGRDELHAALVALGAAGFGKDANVGLGKFDIDAPREIPLTAHPNPDAWFTLAPCAPQGLGWNARRSFYRPFTRYGRHGDIAARMENPFKSPLLLAATGALLSPLQADDWARGWVGQGLGGQGPDGSGKISRALPQTVHQGYAPAIPVRLPEAA